MSALVAVNIDREVFSTASRLAVTLRSDLREIGAVVPPRKGGAFSGREAFRLNRQASDGMVLPSHPRIAT
jgi:hypothetical protein